MLFQVFNFLFAFLIEKGILYSVFVLLFQLLKIDVFHTISYDHNFPFPNFSEISPIFPSIEINTLLGL